MVGFLRQIAKGTTEDPLVSPVMQGQQWPGNHSRNFMQGHKYISNVMRNTELSKTYSKAGTLEGERNWAGCFFGRNLKQERVNQGGKVEHQKIQKQKDNK